MANTWAQSEDDQAKGLARETDLGLQPNGQTRVGKWLDPSKTDWVRLRLS